MGTESTPSLAQDTGIGGLPIAFREASAADLPLILSSWTKSYRRSPWAAKIPRKIYFEQHAAMIKDLMQRALILCAVNVDEPEQVYGWVCYEQGIVPVIHYVYVKQPFRGFKIGSGLFKVAGLGPFYFTHESEFFTRFGARAIFAPYAAFFPLKGNQ